MRDLIDSVAREIAAKHARIIEIECKQMCEKYHCLPSELQIDYYCNGEIKISIPSVHLKIENKWHIENGVATNVKMD